MDKIQFRRDSLANWKKANPILAEGEIGLILDEVTNEPTQNYKLGDGVKTWEQLPIRGFNGNIVNELGDSENKVVSQKGIGINFYQKVYTNDCKINSIIKELYLPNTDINIITGIQISKAGEYEGKYNNIIRFKTSDGVIPILFSSGNSEQEALNLLKPYNEQDNKYIIIDWDKIKNGTTILNTESNFKLNTLTKDIEYNPEINNKIQDKEINKANDIINNILKTPMFCSGNGTKEFNITKDGEEVKIENSKIATRFIIVNGKRIIYDTKPFIKTLSIPNNYTPWYVYFDLSTKEFGLSIGNITENKTIIALFVDNRLLHTETPIIYNNEDYSPMPNRNSDITDNQNEINRLKAEIENISQKKVNQFVFTNNSQVNSFIKELYLPDVNINEIEGIQISKAAEYQGRFNNIIRFKIGDSFPVRIVNGSYTSKKDALSQLKAFNTQENKYIIVDWDKFSDGENFTVQNGLTVNNGTKELTFNPSIENYIQDKKIQKLEGGMLNNTRMYQSQSLGISEYQRPIAEINHFIIYGQSLSTGQQTCPQVSRENYKGNLMVGQFEWIFGTGHNTNTTFTPLRAISTRGEDYIPTDRNDQTNGETPNINFANASKFLLDSYLLSDNRKILATSCGTGGLSIEMLSKDCPNSNGVYNNFKATPTKCKELAKEKSIVCTSIIWMQGEYNANSYPNQGWQKGTPATNNKNDYKAMLIGGESRDGVQHNGIINDMITDIKTTYNQEHNPIILCTQIGPNFNRSFDNPIDMALVEANNETDKLVLVTPTYRVTDRGAHLDANGSRWLGEFFAKVWYKRVLLNERWKPLQPNKITRNNNTIDITFDVPEPPLVFDTNQVREVKNYGFSIKVNGQPKEIKNIEIISFNKVRITTEFAITGTLEVAYATQGVNYGNLRDSDKWIAKSCYVDLDSVVSNPAGISYRPAFEPKDEKGKIIYGKPYPCENFCLKFYYKLDNSINELNISTM